MKPSHAIATCALLAACAAQQAAWGQCGGSGWSGATTCVSGYACTKANDYYSQCQPGSPGTGGGGQLMTPSTATDQPTSVTLWPSTTTASSGGSTACPSVPSSLGAANSILPNPFQFAAGGAVMSKAHWTHRQNEISQLLQRYELGTLSPIPSSVTGFASGNTLTISFSESDKSISFSVTVNVPSSGTAPFPAIIAYGTYGASTPIPTGVATILFNNDDIAAQQNIGSRGRGKTYDLYGSSHPAGALTSWA